MKTIIKNIVYIIIAILISLQVPCYIKAEGLEGEAKKLIESYFHAQYKCLVDLEQKDLKELYYIDSVEGENAYVVDREALSYIISCRLMQDNDLRLKKYKFELDYKSIEVQGDIAHIVLMENSEFEFNFIKGSSSKKHNIEHKFQLKKSGDRWKILSHDSTEDEFRIIRDGIREFRSHEDVKEFYIDLMRKNKMDYKKSNKSRGKKSDKDWLRREKSDVIESSIGPEVRKIVPYNRECAVDYAYKWSQNGEKLRNSPPWGNYDPPNGEGDCTNFVSQCIFAGGIPMDYRGPEYEQWKWYSNTYDAEPVPRGRVASWTGVEALYNYCKLNNGGGMSAEVDTLWENLHIGDVVQFGKTEDDYFHSVIITGYVYDDENILRDFLISCHTTDRHNYPLSAYSYPLRRYIHINGWKS